MRLAAFVLPLVLIAAVAGCATSSQERPAGSDATAAPATPAVAIPSASARRVVLTMTGPKTVVESSDWAEMKREWRETFADHAREAGVDYRFADTVPAPGAEDGTLLVAEISDYRIVGIGARVWLGMMTGNAYINANVRYVDLRTGRAFGEQAFNTRSSAWGGVFARVTPQQVDAIATGVFENVKAARR